MDRGIPKGARKLDELLAQRRQWNDEVRALFRSTREAMSVSEGTFATAIGTSQSYVNDIEHGRKTPSAETLEKLRSVLKEARGASEDED